MIGQPPRSTLSPMLALARKLKTDHPDHQVVFIGPCIAKKSEVMEDRTCDYAITFEELAAMFVSRHINPQEVKADDMKDYASTYGRNFAHSGGVAAAVAQAAKEAGDPDSYSIVQADGGFECKKQLTLMKFGKFNADILEGMNCVGGCVNGPAVISDPVIVKGRMIKENMALDKKTIAQGVDVFDMKGFDIEIKDKPQ